MEANVMTQAVARNIMRGSWIYLNSIILTLPGGRATLAQCDQWSEFASNGQVGLNDVVTGLKVFKGDLIAAGFFTHAGNQVVNYIARWDGNAWHPFNSNGQIGVAGSPGPTHVYGLATYGSDLVVGGDFDTVGGLVANNIARWDGSAWHAFVSGPTIGANDDAGALFEFNGDLIAGGLFKMAGGQTVNRIARWDGSSWHAFTAGGQIGVTGGTIDYNYVSAMAVYAGDLVVGGLFTTAGGQTVNHIARWNGINWIPLTSTSTGISGMDLAVTALTSFRGDLIASGWFTTAGGTTVNNVARWDGSEWHPLTSGGQIGVSGGSPRFVSALTVYNDDLIAAGLFTNAGGQVVKSIARWDSEAWYPFIADQTGVSDRILDLIVDDNNSLVAGGLFAAAGGHTVNNIARWQDCITSVPGDVTGDGNVNVADLLTVINAWGACADPPATCPTDIAPPPSGDGTVGVPDLLMVINNWG
jgi:hypothetical protein